ncbi:EpsG family protein [Desulfitobacterium metallireducens]|uniref:EpsG family protein n=1 Tax=Desulfitobacterium metallireducens DSM 15288 TaxID=871968 RepID=W0ECQ2_9FIRM|nr:EpsG family protein [Desulfitobacterium metallireducens]AHF08650.1 hypothetical protein DESME_12070 [Desulfitobacterium metallireducens DSM 15288]
MSLYYGLMGYFLIAALILYYGKQHGKKDSIYLFCTMSVLFVLAALRAHTIGNDTQTYVWLFENISRMSIQDLNTNSRYELGYLYYNKAVSIINGNPQVLLAITSLILIVGYARFIRKYSMNVWLSVYLFLVMGYFGSAVNILRQCIAMIVLLYSYSFIKRKKILPFLICVILATTFHKTAIVFVLAYPISKMRINYKTIGAFTAGTIVVYIVFTRALNVLFSYLPIYQYYLGGKYMEGGIRTASVVSFGITLCIFLVGLCSGAYKRESKLVNENGIATIKENNENQIMTIFLMFSLSVTVISFKFNLLDRMSEYFSVFSIVYLPNILRNFKNKNLSVLLTAVVIVAFTIYFTTIQLYRPDWNYIYPYEFFWQH